MGGSKTWMAALFAMVTLAAPVRAGEGFSVSLGVGGGFWRLPAGDLGKTLQRLDVPRGDQALLTEPLADGLALRFAMAYNIRDLVSIELGASGHGFKLDEPDAIGGSGHFALVVHFHPFGLFMPDRDFDASVFLGGGYAILGGGQAADDLSRGLDGGLLECGLAGRYFFTPWFSLGAEVRLGVPFFSRWHVDWEDDEHYGLDDHPEALFTALLITPTFHFAAR